MNPSNLSPMEEGEADHEDSQVTGEAGMSRIELTGSSQEGSGAHTLQQWQRFPASGCLDVRITCPLPSFVLGFLFITIILVV